MHLFRTPNCVKKFRNCLRVRTCVTHTCHVSRVSHHKKAESTATMYDCKHTIRVTWEDVHVYNISFSPFMRPSLITRVGRIWFPPHMLGYASHNTHGCRWIKGCSSATRRRNVESINNFIYLSYRVLGLASSMCEACTPY